MPVSVSYPGVYIEEIPSGVRTIVGVSTSVAAFLGRAASGPPDEPVEVNGISEFERLFGPVSPGFPMSLAVRDFFLNGGSRAIVVRLFNGNDGEAGLTIDDLKLEAASPGKWGEKLSAELKILDKDDPAVQDLKRSLGIADSDLLFNLDVRDSRPGGRTEQHRTLTLADSRRRLDRVLGTESSFVRWELPQPADMPKLAALIQKEADVAAARKTLETEQKKNPPDPVEIKKAEDALKAALEARDKAATATGKNGIDSSPLGDPANFGSREKKSGIYALEKTDFNLLCIPPDTRGGSTLDSVYVTAMAYCVERRAMLIVDPPHDWTDIEAKPPLLGKLTGPAARNAAIYFPRVLQTEGGEQASSVACGAIAGIMARTDAQRGVWKAPAGVDANLAGVDALTVKLTDEQNGRLNEAGINCLRTFPVTGNLVWGARTMRGANQLGDEYKYVPVRRLALFLEESLYRGTKWVVFEPNDEPLWAQIRLNVGAFLQGLFRQGAFQGRSPREAYFVKCDKDTTTQNDINLGIVNILVGFAPLKPAEFVVIKIQQLAGQIEA